MVQRNRWPTSSVLSHAVSLPSLWPREWHRSVQSVWAAQWATRSAWRVLGYGHVWHVHLACRILSHQCLVIGSNHIQHILSILCSEALYYFYLPDYSLLSDVCHQTAVLHHRCVAEETGGRCRPQRHHTRHCGRGARADGGEVRCDDNSCMVQKVVTLLCEFWVVS